MHGYLKQQNDNTLSVAVLGTKFARPDGMKAKIKDVRAERERDFFAGNLLVRIRLIIVMIRWIGLAPWEFEYHYPGSLASTFLGTREIPSSLRPNLGLSS